MSKTLEVAIKRLFSLAIFLKVGLFLFREQIPERVYFYAKTTSDWIVFLVILAWILPWLKEKLFIDGKISLQAIKTTEFSRYLPGIAIAVLFFGGLEIYVHTLSFTRLAMNDLGHSPQGVQVLGQPMRAGRFISYRFSGGGTLTAYLSIPVSGPKSSGELKVEAKQVNRVWEIEQLSLLCNGCGKPVEIEHK